MTNVIIIIIITIIIIFISIIVYVCCNKTLQTPRLCIRSSVSHVQEQNVSLLATFLTVSDIIGRRVSVPILSPIGSRHNSSEESWEVGSARLKNEIMILLHYHLLRII